MPNNCNLTADFITKAMAGPSQVNTTLVIQNLDGGAALFQTMSYGGQVIGTAATSVTFVIQPGDNKLSYIYEGSAAGHQIAITDPCGKLLDAFPSDPGNPRIQRQVVGGAPAKKAGAAPAKKAGGGQ
jgi:hypothetical protein